ncbi:serine/threonine-protein kinase [Roseiconus lacunae]|uniref:Protein kinase n=1 Tax=Roseiconus lacunae TaxID=2605694 RepID=A0ABT7PCI7_9BACT|nr:serine/threonine-protein kinase [Roseiconus lacunae]MDM4014181.1 protein kinase [Roseiconus lacunae]
MGQPSLESLRRIESICTRFENQWLSGEASIAPLLIEIEREQRSELFTELVALDIEYRRGRGEQPTEEHYQTIATRCGVSLPSQTLRSLLKTATNESPGTELSESEFSEADTSEISGPKSPTSDRYHFIEKVGSGGNGDVWRVYDQISQRTLAVKLLRHRRELDRNADARIEREALVTGKLQHPGIPPIYDRGRLADGTPYFSMKLIGGETLEDILLRDGDNERRIHCLGIFEQLTQTVAYAHSQGVIHRDLKPRNVMVGKFGEVQVMDWGMAKRLSNPTSVASHTSQSDGQALPKSTSDFFDTTVTNTPSPNAIETWSKSDDESWEDISHSLTVAGDVMGTPAYMSPEQARGEIDALDRRSDVFTLGVILFEILTGSRLHHGTGVAEAMRRTATYDFGAVFERIDANEDNQELCRLCKRCLQNDPDARPADAGIVASEITAYLESAEQRARQADIRRREESVRSAEDSKRRRLQTRAAVLVAFISLLGTGVTYWQWQEASRANARASAALTLADDRFEQAQQVVDDFLSEVADDEGLLAKVPGTQPIRRRLLEQARDYYEVFLAESRDDRNMQFETALAYRRLGDIAQVIDPIGEEAMAYRNKVITICDSLLAEKPDDPELLQLHAESFLAIGMAHRFAKRPQLELKAFEQAKEGYERLIETRGTDHDHFRIAIVFQRMGRTLYHLKNFDESESSLAEALRRSDAYWKEHQDDSEICLHLRDIHRTLGVLYGWGKGDWKQCNASFRKALEFSTLAAERSPGEFKYLDRVASDQMNLAMSCNHIQQHDEANANFLRCIDTLERLLEANPTVAEYRRKLANVYSNYGTYSNWRNRLDDALKYADKSYQVASELVANHPTGLQFRMDTMIATIESISCQMAIDRRDGLPVTESIDRVQPKLVAAIERSKRDLKVFPNARQIATRTAIDACLLRSPDVALAMELTQFVNTDPASVDQQSEAGLAARALAFVRSGEHDRAWSLLESYSKPLKKMESRLIRCIATASIDIGNARQQRTTIEADWSDRKHYEYFNWMLRAEATALLK